MKIFIQFLSYLAQFFLEWEFLSHLAHFFLEWEMFQHNCRGNQNTHFVFSKFFFSQNRAFYEKMWKKYCL